jgi:hypothetical protein
MKEKISYSKETFFDWAYNHTDIANAKYSTKLHGLFVSITGTIIFISLSLLFNHFIFGD